MPSPPEVLVLDWAWSGELVDMVSSEFWARSVACYVLCIARLRKLDLVNGGWWKIGAAGFSTMNIPSNAAGISRGELCRFGSSGAAAEVQKHQQPHRLAEQLSSNLVTRKTAT